MEVVLEGGRISKATSSSSTELVAAATPNTEKDERKVKKKDLQAVLERCQRAIELLRDDGDNSDDSKEEADEEESNLGSYSPCRDTEANELYDMIKYRVGGPEFLQRIEDAQASFHLNLAEEGNSWDVVSENDLWEGEGGDSEQEDYVLVRQEDIVDGIACFMAAYLLSLKQTKDLSPNQLQDALRKTFSLKKRKGKIHKAWDGSKVVYNLASWSATAIGIYQNPAILRAASTAFWTSCRVISKLF